MMCCYVTLKLIKYLTFIVYAKLKQVYKYLSNLSVSLIKNKNFIYVMLKSIIYLSIQPNNRKVRDFIYFCLDFHLSYLILPPTIKLKSNVYIQNH